MTQSGLKGQVSLRKADITMNALNDRVSEVLPSKLHTYLSTQC